MKSVYKKMIAVLMVTILLFLLISTSGYAADTEKKMTVHYTFDGNLTDSARNSSDAKAVGGDIGFEKGILGQCAVFKGNYIQIPSSSEFNLGKQFSFSVWVKLDEANANKTNTIISRRINKSEGDTYDSYTIYTSSAQNDNNTADNYIEFCDYNDNLNGANLQSGNSTDFSADWANIIYTCDGKHLTTYVNGAANGTSMVDGSYKNSNREIYIGIDAVGGDDPGYFKGRMDDLRIYNYCLSAQEIKDINSINTFTNKIELTVGSSDLMIDNKKSMIDPSNEMVVPVIDPSTNATTVPIRAIVEGMGGSIAYTAVDKNNPSNNRSMNITLKSNKIWLQLDNNQAIVNGNTVTMSTVARSVEGRTMVPLRFVAENLGVKVLWNGKTQGIKLMFNK